MIIPTATYIAMHKFYLAVAKSRRIRLVEPEKSGQLRLSCGHAWQMPAFPDPSACDTMFIGAGRTSSHPRVLRPQSGFTIRIECRLDVHVNRHCTSKGSVGMPSRIFDPFIGWMIVIPTINFTVLLKSY
ncbi:hypothetical protein MPLB_1460011 [Mesorhizobium sp. ORS 3324]|nr:hypothetical protein MPLB_1460011 [Mesorhizobium sp. ORS 3324]